MAKGFNWTGIEDLGNGSYRTKGKREKTRLLKSLHGTGYAVRSRKNSDGTYTVTAVGALTSRRRRVAPRAPVQAGYRPRYRAARGRYVPLMRRVKMTGRPPRPFINPGGVGPSYSGRPGPRGPSMLSEYLKHRRERYSQEIKAKLEREKTEREISDRMKSPEFNKRTFQRIPTKEEGDRIEAQNKARMFRAGLREDARAMERERIADQNRRQRDAELPHVSGGAQNIRTIYEPTSKSYDWTDAKGPKIDKDKLDQARQETVT